jgi:tryptophanyl-tRNA synthetase
VLGLDGRKMSKSYGNAIFLSESDEETRKKVLSMVTDTNRVRRSDPGEPDRCVAFSLNQFYLSEEQKAEIYPACRGAQIGCVECKKIQAEALVTALAPFRAKRAELAARPEVVEEVLAAGSRRAAEEAGKTMEETRDALKI